MKRVTAALLIKNGLCLIAKRKAEDPLANLWEFLRRPLGVIIKWAKKNHEVVLKMYISQEFCKLFQVTRAVH